MNKSLPRPTVSVVLSNYNHAHFLPDALGAIVGQSYLPKEILITDDASTDNSVAVIEEFSSKFPIVRLLRNEQNIGGIGNVTGAALGGLVIGLLAAFTTIYIGGQWEQVGVFSLLVIILVFRPTGLLGEETPER